MKSVFDLVKVTQFLELTDPKLLGWYLSVPVEDRKLIQEEGGLHQFLQRHPALAVARQLVYVKREKLAMGIIPKNLGKESDLFGCSYSECSSGDGVQLLSQLWEEGGSGNGVVYKEPHSQASFSLDMELERQSQRETAEVVSQLSNQDLGGFMGSEGRSGIQSHLYYPMIDQEQLPETYSYLSACMDRCEWNDTNQPVECEREDSIVATRGSTEQTSPGETRSDLADANSDMSLHEGDSFQYCHDERCGGSYKTDSCPSQAASGAQVNWRCGGENEDYHSIMEEDKSIVMCKTVGGVTPRISGVHSAPVTPEQRRSRYCFTSKPRMAERSTNTLPLAPTCNISVGTDHSLGGNQQAATQTQSPATADKHVITEVHMADLDYLHEEFMKLKYAKEQLLEKMASVDGATNDVGCGLEGRCERAQRAELCLLALQFGMCQQHCWRHYYATPEGDSLLQSIEGPPECLVKVLQVLQSDYREMRAKIQAGVPLDRLKPLSVDSQKVTTGACYVPAQIIGPSKELNASEAWYDAKEDLGPTVSAGKEDAPPVDAEERNDGEVAMVTVNGALSAEDAVKEMNGSSMQGHPVHVTHIQRPSSENDRQCQGQAKDQTLSASHKPRPSGDTTRPKGFKTSSSSASVKQVIRQHPLRSRLEKRIVVCDSPTASGTCVPQHYATMGSFDTLMTRLSERHPEMGRQSIVDALLKLRAKHQGFLCGLPLTTIVEMTSNLLTGSTDLTH
ncbi:RNA-binding protein 44 [Aplochiton taeniatus]